MLAQHPAQAAMESTEQAGDGAGNGKGLWKQVGCSSVQSRKEKVDRGKVAEEGKASFPADEGSCKTQVLK